jgi:hypothetical protein
MRAACTIALRRTVIIIIDPNIPFCFFQFSCNFFFFFIPALHM